MPLAVLNHLDSLPLTLLSHRSAGNDSEMQGETL